MRRFTIFALLFSLASVAFTQGQSAQEKEAEAWADKLAVYQADTDPKSKGFFGVPTMDVDVILANHKLYLEAKKLYDEFLATKIAPDTHWKLRQAEYDIRIALKCHLQSIDNVHNDISDNVRQGQTWISSQVGKNQKYMHSSARMEEFSEQMYRIRKLLPGDDPRRTDLERVYEKLVTDQHAQEQTILKSRKMKPDVYKGGDSARIKELAAKIVGEDTERRYEEANPKPVLKVIRSHITSANWDTESAVEWTDTTKTALQYRVSKGVFVQVAAMVNDNCFVYTLYIHRDKIAGDSGPLIGHVMYRDRFLRENLPK